MSQARLVLGMMLAVLASVSFAAGSASAVVSYHNGAAPISVITTRIGFTVLVLWLFIRLSGGPTRFSRRDRIVSLALGLVLGAQGYTLYEAIGLLPVALAVLTLYLYPLLIALSVHFMGRERVSRCWRCRRSARSWVWPWRWMWAATGSTRSGSFYRSPRR